ncbi:hypothetical protein GUJ93_ZPchr0011g28325 [Zizania palustris]|uniref:Agglutinin domain-containing protein n=1 Tax=Zizania palustris TaxID=103762 RepID=A0A8J5WFK3_ZIZPA|nr:hypothetical protein GUJ93_ZPchr0011g28325 [Zizania palustris]
MGAPQARVRAWPRRGRRCGVGDDAGRARRGGVRAARGEAGSGRRAARRRAATRTGAGSGRRAARGGRRRAARRGPRGARRGGARRGDAHRGGVRAARGEGGDGARRGGVRAARGEAARGEAAATALGVAGQEKLLPPYVVFKGDNGKYLSGRVIQRYNYLQFASDNMEDATVINRTHYCNDGNVRILNSHFGRFWRRSPNWIWADSSDISCRNPNTVFTVVKLGNIFALRNMGNENYYTRLTSEGKTSCLNAAVKTITAEAKLEIREPVLSREIYDVTYDLSKARIYDKKVLAMDSSASDNNGSTNSRIKLSFTYPETEITSWDSSLSLMLGVETKIKAGVPLIADGTATVKAEFTGSYTWGSSIEKSASKQTEYEVDVPPHTRVTVTMLAEKAYCDVPFSYKQRDIMYDGQTIMQTKHDGIYTGANSFSFKFDRKDEKI